jgi:hypothetical protein
MQDNDSRFKKIWIIKNGSPGYWMSQRLISSLIAVQHQSSDCGE